MIHNISISTADDIKSFGDDVNIYPVLLSWAIIIWVCCIKLVRKDNYFRPYFCPFLKADLGTQLWPLSVVVCRCSTGEFI